MSLWPSSGKAGNNRFSGATPLPHPSLVVQDALMTAARAFLLEALGRVAGGGDIDDAELEDAVPNPLALGREEKAAWEELSYWADDGDIRKRDERYAAFKRTRMRDHLAALAVRAG